MVLFIVSSCQQPQITSDNEEDDLVPTIQKESDKKLTYEEEQKCLDANGIWEQGQTGEFFCNLPTSDAGKECTDSNECESFCQAPNGIEPGSKTNGRCYGWKFSWCMQEVSNGIAGHTGCA